MIGHVGKFGVGQHLKKLAGDMGRTAGAGRAHDDRARMRLGVGDKFGNGLCRKRRVHLHDHRTAGEYSDRRHVAGEVEIEVGIKRHVDGIRHAREQQRVTIRRGMHDLVGGQVAAGARPIFNDEGLAEPRRQLLRDQPRQNVADAAGSVADDNGHRPRRIIGLRHGARRQRWRGGRAQGQLQELTA